MLSTSANPLILMSMLGEFAIGARQVSNKLALFRVNLPTGDGDNSDSNSSEELESVIESEPEHHVDFVSLGSN